MRRRLLLPRSTLIREPTNAIVLLLGSATALLALQLRRWDIIEESDLNAMFLNVDAIFVSSKRATALAQQDMDRCAPRPNST